MLTPQNYVKCSVTCLGRFWGQSSAHLNLQNELDMSFISNQSHPANGQFFRCAMMLGWYLLVHVFLSPWTRIHFLRSSPVWGSSKYLLIWWLFKLHLNIWKDLVIFKLSGRLFQCSGTLDVGNFRLISRLQLLAIMFQGQSLLLRPLCGLSQ